MKEEKQKDQLFNEHLKYTGKTLSGEGVRKDKEGNDVDWKKWKLSFESGRQYPWQCTAWSSLSKGKDGSGILLKEMEEGKYYEIVYKWNEYKHEKHGLVRSKVAVLIKESDESKSTQEELIKSKSHASETQNPQQAQKVFADGFVEFAKEYKESMKEGANAMHMLGAYIANKHAEQFSDIITLCKKEFEKKELKGDI